MNIKLIDVDSKIPNLALMQLSAYHKSLGDTVGFDTANPDKIYVSCIFSINKEQALGIKSLYPDTEIIFGGTGINNFSKIPDEAQYIKPNYTLYDMDYDLGFTTRGCIRNCRFCVVPEKEGQIKRWNRVSDFHEPKHRKITLLDNNWFAIKDWFFENSQYIIDNKLNVNVTQGMDIRIITDEIAEQLSKMSFKSGILNFAFDNIKDEKDVLNGIEILTQTGIKARNISFYVLTGFNSTHEEDLHRVNVLREKGCLSFVMQYKPNTFTKMLARYTNKRWIYWSCTFDEYKPYKDYLRRNHEL